MATAEQKMNTDLPGTGLMQRLPSTSRLLVAGVLGLLPVLPSLYAWMAGDSTSTASGWYTLCTWLLFVYVLCVIFRGSRNSVALIQGRIEHIRDGNLADGTAAMPVSEELRVMQAAINDTAATLSRVVARVRSESQLISMVGSRLAVQARELSDRTESQASSLEQSAASIQELSNTTSQSAETARLATDLAQSVARDAGEGGAIVSDAVTSMDRISQRSTQMRDIVATIDAIAFQTNILALNAAVESARAGEAGRGFAVVAAEVRSLAQRCAASASEVRQLIDGSVTEIDEGVNAIKRVSQSLATINDGVRELSGKMTDIAQSSQAQDTSLREVAQAINQLEQITQQNAQMVDRSVASSDGLLAHAQTLIGAVQGMRLQQGCADEAKVLVEKAVQLIDSRGLVEARSIIQSRDHGYVDRDLFIFALDRQNYFRIFGADPSKADKPVVAAPGTDIKELCARVWHMTAEGGGWFEYRSMHPITQNIVDKIGYVLQTADGTLAVACSVNRDSGG